MNCPNCQRAINPGATFCGNCGAQLAQYPPAPAPAPAPAAPQAYTPQPVSFGTTATPPYVAQPTFSPTPAAPAPAYEPATPTLQTAAPVFQPGVAVPPAPLYPAPHYAAQNYPALPDSNADRSGFGIAGFVLGLVGLLAWLIPVIGLAIGVLGLIFGIKGRFSKRKVLAIIGIIASALTILISVIFWGLATYLAIQDNGKLTSTSNTSQSITTACYSTRIPRSLTITRSSSSCSFRANNSFTGEQYVVKVLNTPNLTADNIGDAAKADSQNILNTIPGSAITTQGASTFAGSPAYNVSLNATDGSTGTVSYVYDVTAQGNLVIVLHTQNDDSYSGLGTIEKDWSWL